MEDLYKEIRAETPNLMDEMEKDTGNLMYHLLGRPLKRMLNWKNKSRCGVCQERRLVLFIINW